MSEPATMPDDQPLNERGRAFVQSLERGLAVIRAFDGDHPRMTLSEVARETDLTRAAARRFLLTLVELGYLGTDGRLFFLLPHTLELGYAYLSSLGLPEIAQTHMEALSAEISESCSMSVLDGGSIRYVARVAIRRIMTVGISVGTRFPAFATSMGRVLLAAEPEARVRQLLSASDLTQITTSTVTDPPQLLAILRTVRSQGYALVDEELEAGLRSIAVPIHDVTGSVVAAVNVSTHVSRGTATAVVAEILPPLRSAALAIEADLALTRQRVKPYR